MDTDTARMKAIFVLVATLAFVAGAYLVSFTGFAPDLFPNPQIDPPVQPAGYAFAIWGVIFLWLVASAGFGLLNRADNPAWDAVRWPIVGSFAVGATWNSVANQSPVMATILIWFMLATALYAFLRAPRADRSWLALPLGLYAGWLTAAASVSLGLLGAGYGVLGSVPAAWFGIAVAAVLASGVIRRTGNLAYAAAVVWALVALVVKNWDGAVSVAILAGLAALALVVLAIRVRGEPAA